MKLTAFFGEMVHFLTKTAAASQLVQAVMMADERVD